MKTERVVYDDKIVRWFAGASIIWGLIGMLVGVTVALQLAAWQTNLPPYLSFGRLRPLHTNAVIFAFVGNMIFAGIYYSTQRLLKTRLANDKLSWFHFWGWQSVIVGATVTLPLGITTSKEYAELEWPIDIMIAVVWVAFAINFFWTLAKRREKQLYVALWFYIATIVTITVLHVVNSLAVPYSAFGSYSVFGGVQDALVQWWYGHNAVAFFLTTPILGIMYYFLPKAVDRPVFSYRLSIVHFWGLVFIYIWAGPHHLLYTSLPEWAQTVGMVFSLMLWAPSWGGMINGLLTLRGAWDKLRTDPVLKFFAAGVTFYGMSTFEGPLLSIKAVNGLAHYTDWIVGHVHSGTLGWNGFFAAGMFYWLYPRLWGTKLYSEKAANYHFWIATVGILLYVVSMWVSGITQGLMWRAVNEDTGALQYTFIETVVAMKPMYWTRMVGGTLYFIGFCMLAWNVYMTAKQGSPVETVVEVPVEPKPENELSWVSLVFGKPALVAYGTVAAVIAIGLVSGAMSIAALVVALGIAIGGAYSIVKGKKDGKPAWHAVLEGRALIFTVLTVVAVLVGGIAELIPLVVTTNEDTRLTSNVPYTALELHGRDVYISEGCYTCHSQQVRPFEWETARYGNRVSTIDDSIFDHPFQWGSKRTGPDLAHEGGLRPDSWHWRHMIDPRAVTPDSIMPNYPHLVEDRVNLEQTEAKMRAMRMVGVPYTVDQVHSGLEDARVDGQRIADNLREEAQIEAAPDSQMVALIAYLQRLGRIPTELAEDAEELAEARLAESANEATDQEGGH